MEWEWEWEKSRKVARLINQVGEPFHIRGIRRDDPDTLTPGTSRSVPLRLIAFRNGPSTGRAAHDFLKKAKNFVHLGKAQYRMKEKNKENK